MHASLQGVEARGVNNPTIRTHPLCAAIVMQSTTFHVAGVAIQANHTDHQFPVSGPFQNKRGSTRWHDPISTSKSSSPTFLFSHPNWYGTRWQHQRVQWPCMTSGPVIATDDERFQRQRSVYGHSVVLFVFHSCTCLLPVHRSINCIKMLLPNKTTKTIPNREDAIIICLYQKKAVSPIRKKKKLKKKNSKRPQQQQHKK